MNGPGSVEVSPDGGSTVGAWDNAGIVVLGVPPTAR